MRGRKAIAVVLLAGLVAAGCGMGPGLHRVRILVDAPGITVAEVAIGDVTFGDVANGTPTTYIGVPEDIEHDLTVGGDVVGTVLLTGNGAHDWTLTIGGDAPYLTFTITEDAP